MNENIERLAEEATEYMEFNDDTVLKTSLDDVEYEIPAEFIKIFAELIVRECATLAFDGPNGILEHFGLGVEE